MTQTADPVATTLPFRFFATEVRAVRRLSPHFVRVTFTGDDLDRFADNGADQRIKLIPALPGAGLAHVPTGPDWRALPAEQRNPIRTYTVRAVRPDLREVDVDMVLHGVDLEDVDVDHDVLWEVPEEVTDVSFYAWLGRGGRRDQDPPPPPGRRVSWQG